MSSRRRLTPGEAGEAVGADADLEAAGVGLLEQSVGIRVTRFALPQRSPRPFSVPCTCRAPASIAASVFATALPVSSWVWMPSRSPGMPAAITARVIRADLGRQRAAVGVAEHHPAGAGVERGLQAGERVVGVGPPAVEEVLGVEERLAALGLQEARSRWRCSRGSPRALIAERGRDVEVVGLADEADRGRAGVHAPRPAPRRSRPSGPSAWSCRRRSSRARRELRRAPRRRRCRSGWRRASRPRRSRCRARRGRGRSVSLSSTEKSTPWLCWPSRSVVSKR